MVHSAATNGPAATYTVTLYMTTAELNGNAPATFKLYKSTAATVGAISSTNTQTVATTVNTNANYTSFTASFTGLSLFFIGNESIVLPLELVQFSSTRNSGSSKLVWQTANETNTKNFVIERSKEGNTYQAIGTVNAAGTGAGQYNYTDAFKFSGNMYYRLKMVDIDGRFTYSPVIILKELPENKVTVYPNPFDETFTIDLGSRDLLNSVANIVDAKGGSVRKLRLSATQTQVNMKGMPTGNYVIQFADGSSMKIVKR